MLDSGSVNIQPELGYVNGWFGLAKASYNFRGIAARLESIEDFAHKSWEIAAVL